MENSHDESHGVSLSLWERFIMTTHVTSETRHENGVKWRLALTLVQNAHSVAEMHTTHVCYRKKCKTGVTWQKLSWSRSSCDLQFSQYYICIVCGVSAREWERLVMKMESRDESLSLSCRIYTLLQRRTRHICAIGKPVKLEAHDINYSSHDRHVTRSFPCSTYVSCAASLQESERDSHSFQEWETRIVFRHLAHIYSEFILLTIVMWLPVFRIAHISRVRLCKRARETCFSLAIISRLFKI